MGFNLFKKRKCGNCKYFAPKYPDASPDAMFYLLGLCDEAKDSSGILTADFVYQAGAKSDPLIVGRNFGCVRHEFK